MKFKIVPLPFFAKQLKRLSRKYPSLKQEYALLIEELEQNPEKGIPLGKNCYKIRISIASKGKGKSGGVRVITFVVHLDETVFLLTMFDKSEQADISSQELEAFIKTVKDLNPR